MVERGQPERGSVYINGTDIYYETLGQGSPLVMIHAGLLDLRMWDEQFWALAEHYQVIRYDLRGHGRTAMPVSRTFSHADDLSELLEYLEIDKVALVGLALGARVALDFTLDNPGTVTSLVLAAPFIGGYDNISPEQEMRDEELARVITNGDQQELLQFWLIEPAFPQPRDRPVVYQHFRQMLDDHDFQDYLNPARERHLSPRAIERFDEVHVPMLVIVGDQDKLEVGAMAELLEAGVVDVQLVTLRGTGHFVNMERPQQFNRLVDTFLKRLP